MSSVKVADVQQNYTVAGLMERIKAALQAAGHGDGPLQWSDLTSFDQFHVRGLEASKELACALQLTAGETLLDLGSGLGGPARYLAAMHEAQVTGIDLTDEFVEVSTYLSRRCSLQDKTSFVEGDAAALPFPAEYFDHAWTQHVAMNIPDKQKLYAGVRRILKPGGTFALYDAVQGGVGPILYPTPWAREAGISFVATTQEVEEALRTAGFTIISSVDQSGIGAEWFRQMRTQQAAAQASPQPPNPLSASAILGPELGPAVANFGKNLLEDRVRILQVIAKKQ